jgi:hypothetical protein
MEIIVHDTISLLRPYFTVRTRPKELFARVQATLVNSGGLFDALSPITKARSRRPAPSDRHPTVGLPPFAGFEVGYRLVRANLEHTGESLPEAIGKPTEEILGRRGYGGLWS